MTCGDMVAVLRTLYAHVDAIFEKTHSRCGFQKQCLRANLWDFCAPLRQRARGGLWQRFCVDDHFNVQNVQDFKRSMVKVSNLKHVIDFELLKLSNIVNRFLKLQNCISVCQSSKAWVQATKLFRGGL